MRTYTQAQLNLSFAPVCRNCQHWSGKYGLFTGTSENGRLAVCKKQSCRGVSKSTPARSSCDRMAYNYPEEAGWFEEALGRLAAQGGAA